MYRKKRTFLPDLRYSTEIRYYDRIDADIVKSIRILAQHFDLFIFGKAVYGYVYFFASFVGIVYSLTKLLKGKACSRGTKR